MSTPFDTISGTAAAAPAARTSTAPASLARAASEKQIDLLRTLMTEKAERVNGGAATIVDHANIEAWLASGISRDTASENIGRLIEEAKAARASKPAAERIDAAVVTVPAGSYALDSLEGATNEVVFYRVDRPETGKWAGRVFVNREVGGNPDIAVKGQAAKNVLARIEAVGAEAASARYGQETQRCGVCHTKLTNDDSRARGIGPKCAANLVLVTTSTNHQGGLGTPARATAMTRR